MNDPNLSNPSPLAPPRRKGLLLINVGTPDAPHTKEVRRYLAEFLGDPRVIDTSALVRWLLLHGYVLRTRPARSAEAYRKIWLPEGSPLLHHCKSLQTAVADALAGEYVVELAMRYGAPSIEHALERLRARGIDALTVFPLYPQYASSSTGTSLERVFDEVGKKWNVLPVSVVPPFFAADGFLDAYAEVGRPVLETLSPDHVLFSFHGLPERQILKSDASQTHCLKSDHCCDALGENNRWCYRAQAFATARALASRLDLPKEKWTVTFQSRLGRTPWLRPFTDVVVPELAGKGTKRLAVFCPAFVADCLETVEEIGIRARASFISAGGEELKLVPSLNATPAWVKAVVEQVRALRA